MKYYAIQEKATGRFISGTDFSRADGKPRQMFVTPSRAPLLISGDRLGSELRHRHIDLKHYEVVVVEVRKVEENA
jgi:hypothetical protein